MKRLTNLWPNQGHALDAQQRRAQVMAGRSAGRPYMRMITSIGRLLLLVAVTVGPVSGCGSDREASPVVPDDFEVHLERQICFGPCPVYRTSVSRDGVVRYEGIQFVAVRGVEQRTISAEQLVELYSVFQRAGFSEFENYMEGQPGCTATDSPTAITSLRAAGVFKQVVHYYGCEPTPALTRLSNLERQIDVLLQTDVWVRCGPSAISIYSGCSA